MDTLPRARAEFEPTPERADADFEGYRKVVDALSPAFRKVGIVDMVGYDQALRDPRTVRLTIGSVGMPLITPIEYVSGYDADRTGYLTGQENVYVMTLPLAVLGSPDVTVQSEGVQFPAEASAIVVETDHEETAEVQSVLPEVLAGMGDFAPQEFLDTRIRQVEQQPAMMAMYETRFEAVGEDGETIPSTGKDFFEAYDELAAERHPITEHTKLFRVEELRDNEVLMQQLWDLCHDRFDWLGEAHPVSMEDTKDFFIQMVLNDDTHTIVRYDDEGVPACLGFFMSNLEECTWLKPEFKAAMERKLAENGEDFAYFFGIAGRSARDGMHYGKDVMQLLALMAARRGGTHRLAYESTNMSGRYVKRLVGQNVSPETNLRMVEPIEKVAQLDYWYLAPAEATAR